MRRLAELAVRIETETDWVRPSAEQLRGRNRRRRFRRRLCAAFTSSVAVLGLVAAASSLGGSGDGASVDVVDMPVTSSALPGPDEPDLSGLPDVFQPAGPVEVVQRGVIGGVPWYAVVFQGTPGQATEVRESVCSLVVDADGGLLSGGCGLGGAPEASGFGFSQIGGVDVMAGDASLDVDTIEATLSDGRIITATPVASSRFDIAPWVLELPSRGDTDLERSQAQLEHVVAISGESTTVLWPLGVPGSDGTAPPTTGTPANLDFGSVQLRVDRTTPNSDGTPRLCTTASKDGSAGVRSCFPLQPRTNGFRWAYLDHTESGWILSAVLDSSNDELTLTTEDGTSNLSRQSIDLEDLPALAAYMTSLPSSPHGQTEVVLRWDSGFHKISYQDSFVAVGGRQPVAHPIGEGVSPPFN